MKKKARKRLLPSNGLLTDNSSARRHFPGERYDSRGQTPLLSRGGQRSALDRLRRGGVAGEFSGAIGRAPVVGRFAGAADDAPLSGGAVPLGAVLRVGAGSLPPGAYCGTGFRPGLSPVERSGSLAQPECPPPFSSSGPGGQR